MHILCINNYHQSLGTTGEFVCVASLKCTYAPTVPICPWEAPANVVDAFHSKMLLAGQICLSKGARPYKYHERRVGQQTSVASFFSWRSHLEYVTLASAWNTHAMQPMNFSTVLVLFLCCVFQLSSAWYAFFFSREESFKCYSFYGFAIGTITYRFNMTIFVFSSTGP